MTKIGEARTQALAGYSQDLSRATRSCLLLRKDEVRQNT